MRLGGWLRLWVVLGVLWAIPVALLGYNNRPTVEYIKYRWINEATDKMAERVNEKESSHLAGYQFLDSLRKDYPADDQIIAELERVATKPTVNQTLFAADLKAINAKFQEEVANHPSDVRQHAFSAFLWWLVPMLFLLGLGYGVAWIRRGFHHPKND